MEVEGGRSCWSGCEIVLSWGGERGGGGDFVDRGTCRGGVEGWLTER